MDSLEIENFAQSNAKIITINFCDRKTDENLQHVHVSSDIQLSPKKM